MMFTQAKLVLALATVVNGVGVKMIQSAKDSQFSQEFLDAMAARSMVVFHGGELYKQGGDKKKRFWFKAPRNQTLCFKPDPELVADNGPNDVCWKCLGHDPYDIMHTFEEKEDDVAIAGAIAGQLKEMEWSEGGHPDEGGRIISTEEKQQLLENVIGGFSKVETLIYNAAGEIISKDTMNNQCGIPVRCSIGKPPGYAYHTVRLVK